MIWSLGWDSNSATLLVNPAFRSRDGDPLIDTGLENSTWMMILSPVAYSPDVAEMRAMNGCRLSILIYELDPSDPLVPGKGARDWQRWWGWRLLAWYFQDLRYRIPGATSDYRCTLNPMSCHQIQIYIRNEELLCRCRLCRLQCRAEFYHVQRQIWFSKHNNTFAKLHGYINRSCAWNVNYNWASTCFNNDWIQPIVRQSMLWRRWESQINVQYVGILACLLIVVVTPTWRLQSDSEEQT